MKLSQAESKTWYKTLERPPKFWYLVRQDNWYFGNDLNINGSYSPENRDVECVPYIPVIMTGESLSIWKPRKNYLPCEDLIIRSCDGFRHRIKLKDYKFEIPFISPSTDIRVKSIPGTFYHDSGQLVHEMGRAMEFYLSWVVGSKPKLHIMKDMVSSMIVESIR